jgi:hypothetical protein
MPQGQIEASPGFLDVSPRVCPEFARCIAKNKPFAGRLWQGGGLKKRWMAECEISIGSSAEYTNTNCDS